MNEIIEFGKRGAEQTEDYVVPQAVETSIEAFKYSELIKRFPKTTIETESHGSKRDIEVRDVRISNPTAFSVVHALAKYSPMVYVSRGKNQKAVMGMLSPNYDTEGEVALPTIKVLTLNRALPLTNDLLPDAGMASMLAGLANAEGEGVGSHDGKPASDFEHRLTMLGAVSLNDSAVALSHKNHNVRVETSVATGLTDGSLGTIYEADTNSEQFSGYGKPITFDLPNTTPHDVIYFPDSFIGSAEGWGDYYDDASRYAMGYGLRKLEQRAGANGLQIVNDKLSVMGEAINRQKAA